MQHLLDITAASEASAGDSQREVPHIAGWAIETVEDTGTPAHLPGKYQVSAEVVDIPAGMADTAGSVAGIAEVAVDLPGSWYQTALS